MIATEMHYLKGFLAFTIATIVIAFAIGGILGVIFAREAIHTGAISETTRLYAEVVIWLFALPLSYFAFKWSVQKFVVEPAVKGQGGSSPNNSFQG